MKPYHTEKYKNFTINIHYDENAENPRDWQDCLTTIVAFAPRHGGAMFDKHQYCRGDFDSLDQVKKHLEENLSPLIIKPLFLYDHGSQSVSTKPFGDRWDSGQIGFVLITRENQAKMGVNDDNLESALEAEIGELDSYLQGQVFGYEILDADGDIVESCWGFIGEMRYAISEAKSVVDALDPKLALTKHGQFVRFERPGGIWSQEYGPFPFVQFTHSSLVTDADGTEMAKFNGTWSINEGFGTDEERKQAWTDVVIFYK